MLDYAIVNIMVKEFVKSIKNSQFNLFFIPKPAETFQIWTESQTIMKENYFFFLILELKRYNLVYGEI